MPKQKRSALIKFRASVLAVVVGTAILGSMTAGQTPRARAWKATSIAAR